MEPRHLALNKAAPKPTTWNRPVTEYTSPSHSWGSELECSSQDINSLSETQCRTQTVFQICIYVHTLKRKISKSPNLEFKFGYKRSQR